MMSHPQVYSKVYIKIILKTNIEKLYQTNHTYKKISGKEPSEIIGKKSVINQRFFKKKSAKCIGVGDQIRILGHLVRMYSLENAKNLGYLVKLYQFGFYEKNFCLVLKSVA